MDIIKPRSFTAAWMGHFLMGPLEFLNTHTENTRCEVSALKLNTPGESRQEKSYFPVVLLMNTRILLGWIPWFGEISITEFTKFPLQGSLRDQLSPNSCCCQPSFREYWTFPHGGHRGRRAGSEHFPPTPAPLVQIHCSEDEQSTRESNHYCR